MSGGAATPPAHLPERHGLSRTPRHLPRFLFSLLLFTLLSFAGATAIRAQIPDPSITGLTYVLAFPDTTRNGYDGRQDTDTRFHPREPRQDSIFIAIYCPTAGEIEITGNGGYSRIIGMKTGGFEVVHLNGGPRAAAPIVTESGGVSNNTFRVEATRPIVVYCFMVTKFGTEAWTPLPVESWGTEYYAAALPGEVLHDARSADGAGADPRPAPAEILVIAAHDQTTVSIAPNGTLNGMPPTTITLRKGQCYQVQSHVDLDATAPGAGQPDLGGTRISASRPVGVISGNTRAQVLDQAGGLTRNSFKNMMIEWIRPVHLHGREFVYLPTYDELRPTGGIGENPDRQRRGEVVRIYAVDGAADEKEPTLTRGITIDGLTGATIDSFSIPRSGLHQELIEAPGPRVYRTDRPAQAFMNTTAVVQFNGTSGAGEFTGTTYEGRSTYMVEMTPRELWSCAAPYYAPAHPAGMNHYLNIVTSEKGRKSITVGGAPMIINHHIEGTDLWWGSRALAAGERGMIQGADTSAKFYAVVYGGMRGFEVFRPGRARKEGDDAGTAGNRDRRDGSGDRTLHAPEYEESIGFMYGYPVASSGIRIPVPDSLGIDTLSDCFSLTVKVRTLNPKPVGLRAISLDSVKNARLTLVDPAPPEPVLGLTKAEVKVSPIDPRKDASGVVVIQDRTGKTWRVPYRYIAEYVNISPSDILDFGEVTVDAKQTRTVTITNPLSMPVSVDTLLLALGTQSFTIVSTKPAISTDPKNRTIIGPGDSLVIEIEVFPTIRNKLYEDSLKAKFGCTQVALPLRAETVQACLFVDDLDFGTLAPGQRKTLTARVCNQGRAELTFNSPWLTWDETGHFSVSVTELDKLRGARLRPGECVEVMVTFVSEGAGTFLDRARFWSNGAGSCRDTAIWRAVVGGTADAREEAAIAGYRLHAIEPNPASSVAAIRFTLARPGMTTVEIFDVDGRPVARPMSEQRSAGDHAAYWHSDGLPSGVYYCRISSGSWSITRPILLVR